MAKLLQNMNIGVNIQRLRKLNRMKQTDVVAKLQTKGSRISRSTYVKIESGSRNIKVSDLVALKEVFDVSYDEFFKGLSIDINKQ